jgi:cation:H+ antiporter
MPADPSWLTVSIQLAAGFLLLFRGAAWMVDGSSSVARRIGVSTLVIGLTIVALGTSAPEIVVSTFAAIDGNADLSLGNVLGSNVANVGLVLGACAIVLPSVLEARLEVRELFWLFFSLAVFAWVARDLAITRGESGLMLATFAVYNATLIFGGRGPGQEGPLGEGVGRPLFLALAGIVAIALGAKLVVDGALGGATRLDLPASVVGLTMVAVGTSLPELAAGLGAAFKGEKDISLGNVVGSNVFNVLAVIGIVGLIQPLDPEHFRAERRENLEQAFRWALREDLWVVGGFSLLAVGLPYVAPGRRGRLKGAVLLAAYATYVVWLCATR